MSKNTGNYRTIDDKIADEIRGLHERHPNLGSKGLLKALKQAGTKVDAKELDRFIKENKLNPKSKKGSWKPVGFQAPWDR